MTTSAGQIDGVSQALSQHQPDVFGAIRTIEFNHFAQLIWIEGSLFPQNQKAVTSYPLDMLLDEDRMFDNGQTPRVEPITAGSSLWTVCCMVLWQSRDTSVSNQTEGAR